MIDSFLTQQVATKAANATGSSATSLQNVGGDERRSSAQAAFIELLNAQLADVEARNTADSQTPDLAPQDTSSNDLLQSDNPLLAQDAGLNVAQLLAASPEIEDQAEEITALLGDNPTQSDIIGAIGQVLALNQQAFDAITKPLVTDQITAEQSLLETGSPSIYDLAVSDTGIFATIQGNDQSLANSLDLTQLSQVAQALEQADLNAENGVTDAGVINLLQSIFPNIPGIASTLNGAGAASDANANILSAAAQAEQALANQLNAIAPGDGDAQGFAESADDAEFEELLQRLQNANNNKADKNGKNATDITSKLKTPGTEQSHVLPPLPALQTLDPLLSGTLGTSFDSPSTSEQGLFGVAASGSGLQSSQGLGGGITQSYSAGQPHPATQLVAITIQKAGLNGTDKSINLRLDPAELGRVEVRLTFGKDKMVKAVLSVEKPETLALLQRDAHSLEKAMTDIGLNAEGGIDLELAQDNQNFDQDGRHDGSRNQARAGDGSSDVENTELLNIPQPDLYIDPATGLVRFDFVT